MRGWDSKRSRRRIAGPQADVACDPEFASTASDALSEEIVIAQIWKGRRRVNHVRITLKRFEGRAIVDVRQFFVNAEGRSQPTTRGVAIGIDKLPELAKALEKAHVRALELDLIEAPE